MYHLFWPQSDLTPAWLSQLLFWRQNNKIWESCNIYIITIWVSARTQHHSNTSPTSQVPVPQKPLSCFTSSCAFGALSICDASLKTIITFACFKASCKQCSIASAHSFCACAFIWWLVGTTSFVTCGCWLVFHTIYYPFITIQFYVFDIQTVSRWRYRRWWTA